MMRKNILNLSGNRTKLLTGHYGISKTISTLLYALLSDPIIRYRCQYKYEN